MTGLPHSAPRLRVASAVRAILLIDDDPAVRSTIGYTYQRIGIPVECAEDASRGLAAARCSSSFDLVLQDLRMPDERAGLALLSALKMLLPRTPIAVISGHATVESTVEAMRRGAFTVLRKPLAVSQLLSLVQRAPILDRRGPHEVAVDQSEPAGQLYERWAWHVWRPSALVHDPRTVEEWAAMCKTSVTTLAGLCRRVAGQARQSRELARIIYAISVYCRTGTPIGLLLDSDPRTLERIFDQAGVDPDAPQSVEDCLRHQRFVPVSNPGIAALRRLLFSGGS